MPMTHPVHALLAGSLIALLAAYIAGCSPTEDVRVTLCKRLADDLLAHPAEIEWLAVENQFHEPEYAVARLRFTIRDGEQAAVSRRAACYFDYDTVEQNAMTHSQPFSAYATQPYRMTLDDDSVNRTRLSKAIHRVLRRQGEKMIERVENGIERATGERQ